VIIGSSKIAQSQTVAFSHFAKKVDSNDAAGAGHILHDDGRISWNMSGQMARHDAAFDVRRPAGGVVDQEGYVLALVIGPFRSLDHQRGQEQVQEKKYGGMYGRFHYTRSIFKIP
jgi:hypothetical protein